MERGMGSWVSMWIMQVLENRGDKYVMFTGKFFQLLVQIKCLKKNN